MGRSNKSMEVLVIGGSGQIGLTLKNLSQKHKKFQYYFPNSRLVDLRKRKSLSEFIDKKNIKMIINMGAYTNVDAAEKNKTVCEQINHRGAEFVALEAKKHNIGLIHFSTDYVFGKGPMKIRREGDKCFPINFYGLSKYRGEKAILKHSKNSIVIRLASVFSNQRINFIKTITKKLLVDKEIKIVSDQKISMVRAFDVAKNIPNLIELLAKKENLESRILHFTNKGYTNWFSVSKIVKNEIESFLNMKLDVKLIPIKSVNWKSDAKRPLDSRLGVNYKFLERNKIYLSDWKESVRNEVKNILPNMIKEIKNED